MTTWEDILGDLVGLADQFVCATCMNKIFRGTSGHFGHKITLNKQAPPGGLRTEDGKAITFQCQDCEGKEPLLIPQIHPNGQIVNHLKIAELPDHEDSEVRREDGDYDNKEEMKKIHQQEQLAIEQKQPLPDDTAQKIANEIDEEQLEQEEEDQDRILNQENQSDQGNETKEQEDRTQAQPTKEEQKE